MYLHAVNNFWNLAQYRQVSFEIGSSPGTVCANLVSADGEESVVELCFHADPQDYEFNSRLVDEIQEDFLEALNDGRGVFDLDYYLEKFDEN